MLTECVSPGFSSKFYVVGRVQRFYQCYKTKELHVFPCLNVSESIGDPIALE